MPRQLRFVIGEGERNEIKKFLMQVEDTDIYFDEEVIIPDGELKKKILEAADLFEEEMNLFEGEDDLGRSVSVAMVVDISMVRKLCSYIPPDKLTMPGRLTKLRLVKN